VFTTGVQVPFLIALPAVAGDKGECIHEVCATNSPQINVKHKQNRDGIDHKA
jgi:hypothetical protein